MVATFADLVKKVEALEAEVRALQAEVTLLKQRTGQLEAVPLKSSGPPRVDPFSIPTGPNWQIRD